MLYKCLLSACWWQDLLSRSVLFMRQNCAYICICSLLATAREKLCMYRLFAGRLHVRQIEVS